MTNKCKRCGGKGYMDTSYYDERGTKIETRLDCDQCVECFKCGKRISKNGASLGMNLPGVTPGPIYFCHDCEPIKSPEEIVASMDSFLMAPEEPGKRDAKAVGRFLTPQHQLEKKDIEIARLAGESVGWQTNYERERERCAVMKAALQAIAAYRSCLDGAKATMENDPVGIVEHTVTIAEDALDGDGHERM